MPDPDTDRIKVVCDGCDRDYQFDKERNALQFISGHSRYVGHDAKRAEGSGGAHA